ncbi:uncharacterized protein LOC100875999 [Megachile rotundata]|uniref:uncharacterized protein LOC100875999 n=1 Tax=Megachile rotundata TaxID=143995 RepID=UPI000614B536|nr:PREDICTED: uncharacterized protein LOC100875999 [Megachile rotundata]
MDTSTCSHGHQNVQSVAQRKFYQWVLKWINGVASNDDEIRDIQQSAKPDVPVLASFLQTIGFKLLSFEKHNDVFSQKSENNASAFEQGALKVTIECGTSNMRAMLKLEGITCRCPNPDHIKDASFWSISGTGPTASTDNIAQKVEETGSTLLPPLTKDVARVLRDVSYKLFDTIVCEPDVNRNTNISISASRSNNVSYEYKSGQNIPKQEVGVMRSNTQPEMRLRADSLNSKCPPENHEKTNFEIPQIRTVSPISPKKTTLQRQRTWDIDIETQNADEEPRPSPPKLTSSPVTVPELSNSLGQISLQSDIDNSKNITEYIIGAQQNLEKALKMLLFKKPTILNDVSPSQALDQDSVSVKSAPAAISPTSVISPYKSSGTNIIDCLKPKQTNLTHEQLITKALSRNATQVPKARRSIEPILSKSLSRKNEDNSKLTIRRSSFYIPSPANSNIAALSKSETKQKLLGIGRYSTSKTSNAIESEISNRVTLTKKGVASPEPRKSASATSGTPNGRVSLIKPPTKISKSIPVKVNTMQPSKINTGIARKPRLSLPKD